MTNTQSVIDQVKTLLENHALRLGEKYKDDRNITYGSRLPELTVDFKSPYGLQEIVEFVAAAAHHFDQPWFHSTYVEDLFSTFYAHEKFDYIKDLSTYLWINQKTIWNEHRYINLESEPLIPIKTIKMRCVHNAKGATFAEMVNIINKESL